MKIAIVFGTRPELIKLFPLIEELKKFPTISLYVINTGQHREMLDKLMSWLGVKPDINLAVMENSPGLDKLTASILTGVTSVLISEKPDWVIVQGDTTTAFAATLAAFYLRIRVGHVEAGLRTFDKYSPWPEEINRTMITKIAELHFAPTKWNKEVLEKEGVEPNRIILTGNTVIDALQYSVSRVKETGLFPAQLKEFYKGSLQNNKIVLITGHRRESFGQGFESIGLAIKELAQRFPPVYFIYPVHLNPNVQEPVLRILGGDSLSNIKLIEPLPYQEFVSLMERSYLILTDSGGVQEEAPSLGKPVLVMRGNTERPEGVKAGSVILTGTDQQAIVDAVAELLTNEHKHSAMTIISNPYGDGYAAQRIARAIMEYE